MAPTNNLTAEMRAALGDSFPGRVADRAAAEAMLPQVTRDAPHAPREGARVPQWH